MRLSVEEVKKEYLGRKSYFLVVEDVIEKDRKLFLVCRCDCGNKKLVRKTPFDTGHVKSCGCRKLLGMHEYLSSHPEIREQNISHAHEYLSSHPEIRQQNGMATGKNNIKRAHEYLSSHPEIRVRNGQKLSNILDSSENMRKECIRSSHIKTESSFQASYRLFIQNLGYDVESEVCVGNHFYDLRVGNKLIECNSSVYHASRFENLSNPNAVGPRSVWRSEYYHSELRDLAISNGFKLLQIWDYDSYEVNNNLIRGYLEDSLDIEAFLESIDSHVVICNDYGFNICGEHIPDLGRWVSTSDPKMLVDESYIKGKVYCYNSGYTLIR